MFDKKSGLLLLSYWNMNLTANESAVLGMQASVYLKSEEAALKLKLTKLSSQSSIEKVLAAKAIQKLNY